jgi:hypothetical protein
MKIELEFISSEILDPMGREEKMDYILERIKKNKILITEGSLSPGEEARLIEETMKRINNKFPGIEVSTLKEKTTRGFREKVIKMLGGKTGGLTVIGPSKLIKKIKKEPQQILVLAGK